MGVVVIINIGVGVVVAGVHSGQSHTLTMRGIGGHSKVGELHDPAVGDQDVGSYTRDSINNRWVDGSLDHGGDDR